jgi:GDP-L-fucose synthase
MRQRIVVTGGTAVVGTALRSMQGDYPQYEFVFVGSKDCNLTERTEVGGLFMKHQPDVVIHLAALSGGVGLSMKYPATILRDNVLMNIFVLEAARLCGVKKIVMTLSTGMYPAKTANPIREEYLHNGYPHESNYGYSFAKRLVDPLIKAYRAEYEMSAIGLVPNAVFGENDGFNSDDANMTAALIRRFHEHRNDSEPIGIWGDGSPLREVTYAKDIARGYMWCVEHYDEAQILHIGTSEEHSVREIAYMIAEIFGIPKERIVFDISKPSGQSRKSSDNSRFVKLAKFQYTPFRTALENTIRWYCETYDRNPSLLRTWSKIRGSNVDALPDRRVGH